VAKKELFKRSAEAAQGSVTADKAGETPKNLKSHARRPGRYIAPQKRCDWYEKAEVKIAIRKNPKTTQPWRA
jgi:hypothetical protein